MYYPKDIHFFLLGLPNVHEAQQADPIVLALSNQGVYTMETFAGIGLFSQEWQSQDCLTSGLAG